MFDGVIIMAAGNGQRLKPLTDYVPKPFIKVNDKQLIEYQFDLIKKHRINNVVISTQSSFLKHFNEIPHSYSLFINQTGINGGFLNYFIKNNIKGMWLVLCSDIIVDIDLLDLYDNVKNQNFVFCVTPMKSEKIATHKLSYSDGVWNFNPTGDHILSGISIINFDKFDNGKYSDYDFETMWNKSIINNDIIYSIIKPDYWKSFDYYSDF